MPGQGLSPGGGLVVSDPFLVGAGGLVGARPGAGEARVDPARVGPARVGPARVGPARVGPARVGPARVGPARVGPARVGPARVGPARVGPARVSEAGAAVGNCPEHRVERDRPVEAVRSESGPPVAAVGMEVLVTGFLLVALFPLAGEGTCP